jgi:uncharacterized protein YyaL (SSP411 family)
MNLNGHLSLEHISNIDLNSLPENGGPDFNRLIFEKSPYLLQHARNPIDWRAWNNTTLELARELDKPIFLSIGYSTCHWCHVMADESFSDAEVADIINHDYIAIKVDREERPDIDSTYMQACQSMTGSGGWPLTVVLTPALLPFFAATYIPKNDRSGMVGLTSLLRRISELWKSDRDKINASGNQIYASLKRSDQQNPGSDHPGEEIFRQALNDYKKQYDPLYAGLGQAPKFPAPHNLSLLIRLGHRYADRNISNLALDTLKAIRFGGIYDQLGGGIHRYSVDERWLVPHFEKMLYDQALLILTCVDAWQADGDMFFREMALDTANYVTSKLRSENGGFYCGEDADTEGKEGTSYLWTTEQVRAHLSDNVAADVIRMFGMREEGNFEGANILHLPEGLDDDLLKTCRESLLPVRETRIQPHKDDKVITAWNGLTIAALAKLALVTGQTDLADIASRGIEFVKKNLFKQGRLLRRWRQGDAGIPAFLEDYTFMIWGLLELYRARFDTGDLEWATRLADAMLELFSDGSGGLYDTGHDVEKILIRGRDLQDGALPSGNGTAAMVLLRLGLLTGREDYTAAGKKVLASNTALIQNYPTAFSMSLIAVDYAVGPSACLTLAAGNRNPTEMLKTLQNDFHPRVEIILKRAADTNLESIAPITAGKTAIQSQATAWLCQDRSCREPLTDPEKLSEWLKKF